MTTKLIVLSGKRYSGKSICGTILNDIFSYPDFALADQVKIEASKVISVPDLTQEQVYHRLLVDQAFKNSWRHVLIEIGDGKRKIDPDYWLDALDRELKKHRFAVVTDVRFPRELEYFKFKYPNCVSVRVEADDAAKRERGWVYDEVIDTSVSECSLDGQHFDVMLDNGTGVTVGQLKGKLAMLIA